MREPVTPTPLTAISKRPWDVVVIGAGPAGALAACLLSRAGKAVLLVDAKAFPRTKACGGCLNNRAVSLLRQFDLEDVLDEANALPLETFRWCCREKQVVMPMSGSVAVERAAFDEALVGAAVGSGTRFVPSTAAQVLPETEQGLRQIKLKNSREVALIAARAVVCADGLGQSSLRRLARFSSRVASASRIGLATTIPDASPDYAPKSLTMAVSERGYVGVTRTGNGRLTVAAAIDVRRSASPGETIESILRACGMPVPAALERAEWTGTPPLTRRSRHVAAERLFVVGDSAGYVEPFTGEGMSFAMGSAARLAPLAAQAVDFWHDSLAASWERQLKREVFAKQWTCRCLKRLLRSPALCGMAITACRKWPTIPRRIMARLNG